MRTILIVDDSQTIRRMVKASLDGRVDATFAEASSGLDAIETLAVRQIDAIVLDLNMPDMHGLDVLRFVRAHGQYRHLPVLVLTTRGDVSSRDAAMQAGASAYMTKPFVPSVLAASLKDIIPVAPVPSNSGSEG